MEEVLDALEPVGGTTPPASCISSRELRNKESSEIIEQML